MKKYPYRQIHLDFHTSQYIERIGEEFDKEEFGTILREAKVNSINLFAKCHHGYFYYPTEVGMMHPNLKFDLLGRQIEACKESGVRANIYLSVGIDEYQAEKHPDWTIRSLEGYNTMGQLAGKGMAASNPLLNKEATVQYGASMAYWKFLCINNPEYKSQLLKEIDEILQRYNPPGLWLDIYNQSHCACEHCAKEMAKMGLNPQSDRDIYAHGRHVEASFYREVLERVQRYNPDIDLYHNGFSQKMDLVDDKVLSVKTKVYGNTVLDIESLPSFLWDYNHYTLAVQYFNRKYEDFPITMMSGKFHRIWGDFGTLKNKEAMEYECFRALAYGSHVCLGDQLHPSGKLSKAVYKQIGHVFKSIEDKEPWCRDTKKLSEIGVYLSNLTLQGTRISNEGALRVLTELWHQFDFIDYETDLERYKLVILPDDVPLKDEARVKLEAYMKSGGNVLITGKADLDLSKHGIKVLGEAKFAPRYAAIENFGSIEPMDYVMYLKGVDIEVDKSEAETLVYITEPYFNRTPVRFCSHFQTPPKPEASKNPLIVKSGNLIYVANPLFSDYEKHGVKVYKAILEECIKLLYPSPLVKSELPSTAIQTLRKKENSYILHILNYIIQKKCKDMEIIEDVFPLNDVSIGVRTEECPEKVVLVPSGEIIDFQFNNGYAEFIVPKLDGHTMVEIVMK